MPDEQPPYTSPNTLVHTALALAQKGLAVFPCWPRTKNPVTDHGFQDASTDPDTILRWWHNGADFNIAIATGAVSGVFVVDLDSVEAEAALRKFEIEFGALPPTVEVITARGRHIYFQMPKIDLRNSVGRIAPGIDVKATGGYIMAPPSVHPTGRRYCWSVDSASSFAAAPDWLLNKLVSHRNGNGAIPASEWRTRIKGVSEGERNDRIARLTGYLLRRHVDPFFTLELMKSWNATHCTPLLPEEEVEGIVNSIAGRELKRRAGDG